MKDITTDELGSEGTARIEGENGDLVAAHAQADGRANHLLLGATGAQLANEEGDLQGDSVREANRLCTAARLKIIPKNMHIAQTMVDCFWNPS